LTERTNEDHGSKDFIVSFNHHALFKWDLLIIGLAIWNSVFIPFDLAFEPPEIPFIDLMNSTIELFFMVDIGIAFRTSYLTFEGEEITNPKKIGKHYVFGGAFIFDLLSVIPFNLITPGINLKFMELTGVLKLVHVTRLPHLVAKLNMGEETKAVFKFAQVFFYLVLYIHLVCCGWFFTVRINKIWIPPMEVGYYKTDIYSHQPLLM
jgi:hypothetical protein